MAPTAADRLGPYELGAPHHFRLASFLVAATLIGHLTTGAADARQLILPGTVALLDAAVIPPGAILVVSVRDLKVGVPKDTLVAKEVFDIEGPLPFRFELPYSESSIDAARAYGVEAFITDSRGRRLWETRVPIRVLTLGNQKRVELVLRPAAPPKPVPEATAFALECGTARFDVTLDDHAATIVGTDQKIVLPRVETSVGKKFADGQSTLSVFGQAVYLQLPSRAYRDCKMAVRTP